MLCMHNKSDGFTIFRKVCKGFNMWRIKNERNKKTLPIDRVLLWCWVDSNHRLTDFQSDALPPELQHPRTNVGAKVDKSQNQTNII